MCSSRYSNSSPRFGGLASRCADQEKPRGGHREREDGAAPKRGEDRCIFPSFAPSIANRLHEGAGDEWGNDQAQAWKPTWRQKSVWKNECADDATNRTDDSPAQYCEGWIRLACATERMREAFPAKGEYALTEHLDDEFEEQLKKNLELRFVSWRRWVPTLAAASVMVMVIWPRRRGSSACG